jgi:hypothetical protein
MYDMVYKIYLHLKFTVSKKIYIYIQAEVTMVVFILENVALS